MPLTADAVQPLLRGSFGREYHYAVETETTQRMFPADAGHGAVALAEHQTAGRGRLGRTWVDEPGRGLLFSVLLKPPPPVARWPELTLIAAGAVAAAIGDGATIKHPNDVLVGGRKVAGILADAAEHVVLGIGINVELSPWPGSGAAAGDRPQLLVDVLELLEDAYGAWVAGGTSPTSPRA
jgi:BirA family biotin operon repressor/biotin-[acetyl-CoA-carboxylase] ligase